MSAACHHKTIVKGFVLLWRAEFKCSGKLNCYQGQSSIFEGSRSQVSVTDDTTLMKGGGHHEV